MPIAPPEQGHTGQTGHTGYTGVYRVTIIVGVIYFSLNARQVEVAMRLLDAVVLETSQVTRSARREGTQPLFLLPPTQTGITSSPPTLS